MKNSNTVMVRRRSNEVGTPVKGIFTVRNPLFRQARNNQQYVVFEIRESLIPVRVIVWEKQCHGFYRICHGQQVKLYGQVGCYRGMRQITCNTLELVVQGDVRVNAAITRLRALIAWLPDPALKRFICHVFEDSDIRQKFITVPASLNHHHAYEGGLVVHSVEVAWLVLQQTQVPDKECYIGAVAGLFHDIGKIRTMNGDLTRTQIGQLIAHEQLSMEVLSLPLKRLKVEDPEACMVMMNLLTWKPSAQKRIPPFSVYETIKMADRVSASLPSL